jgi:ribosomal 50S subunit-recycling heat shock protein
MRVDKFLKVSRVIKRREVAKQLADAGLVQCNGKPAKPSTELVIGDTLTLKLGRHTLTVKVLALLPHANKDSASSMYEVIEDKVENRGNEDA